MKRRIFTVLLLATPSLALAQSSAFTYQGRLTDAGTAAGGLHDFRFRLYDSPTGGAQVGSTQCVDNLQVAAGLFVATLDFGQQFTSPADRFIEIDVRRDTGLDCTNTTGYTTLTTRQLITAAPTASHAKSAFALDAPDGSRANVVFVNNAGNVGINNAAPLSRLHVTAGTPGDGIRLSGASGADPAFILGDANFVRSQFASAFSNQSWSTDALAGDTVLRSLSGKLLLQYGTTGSAIAINTANNVGLGTTAPAAKLDVRGDIKLGPTGQFQAPAGEEKLRIIRGVVSGAGGIIVGSGFTVAHPVAGSGQYTITFNTAFPSAPAVTATADGDNRIISTVGATGSWVGFQTRAGGVTDAAFHFIAIGPR
jgi:hypothetical protein